MTNLAFLLLVFVLVPTLIIVLIINMVLMRHRDPSPPGGWQPSVMPPTQPVLMTLVQGPMCTCGGQLATAMQDAGSGLPSVLRCQACGMESTLGPWTVLRERAWPPV